jgi:cytochrome P450
MSKAQRVIAKHCPFNKAIGTALNDVSPARLANHTRERACALAMELTPQCDRAGLTRFIFALPVQVMASLLGVPDARLADVADWVNSFVIAFSPIANPTDIEQGKKAASQLLDLFRALLDAQQPNGAPETLLGVLAQHARRLGCSENDIIIANGIGFMSQSYEATAGLIGNTLLALATHDEVHAAVRRSPDLIGDLIQEVLHWDPPTQSTRRFVACGGMIAGAPMCEGDAILVILAAASRDPAVVGAARFDLFRKNRRIFNFGSGVHACPADRTAPLIAQIAIRHLLDADVELEHLGKLKIVSSFPRRSCPDLQRIGLVTVRFQSPCP